MTTTTLQGYEIVTTLRVGATDHIIRTVRCPAHLPAYRCEAIRIVAVAIVPAPAGDCEHCAVLRSQRRVPSGDCLGLVDVDVDDR